METLTRGIFLNELQIEDNTWQLIFLEENGKVLRLYANGLGKINSKNRNNLKDYSLIEVQYFASRYEANNSGKLKKVTLIKKNTIKDNNSLFIWNIIKKIIILEDNWNTIIFDSILRIIDDEYLTVNDLLLILVKIINSYNFYPEFNKCALCNSNQNIYSFDLLSGGLVCSNCKNKETPLEVIHIIKIIAWFKNEKTLLDSFEINYLKQQFINFFDLNLGINMYELKNIN